MSSGDHDSEALAGERDRSDEAKQDARERTDQERDERRATTDLTRHHRRGGHQAHASLDRERREDDLDLERERDQADARERDERAAADEALAAPSHQPGGELRRALERVRAEAVRLEESATSLLQEDGQPEPARDAVAALRSGARRIHDLADRALQARP